MSLSDNAQKWVFIGAGVVALGAIFWISKRGVSGVAASVAGEAIELPFDVAAETVETVAEQVGIPRTNAQKCVAAKDAGDHLAASAYCTLIDYASWEASNAAGAVQTGFKSAKEIFK